MFHENNHKRCLRKCNTQARDKRQKYSGKEKQYLHGDDGGRSFVATARNAQKQDSISCYCITHRSHYQTSVFIQILKTEVAADGVNMYL